MINIDDLSLYKNCTKKLYDIYMTIVPVGTTVFDKFTMSEVIKKLQSIGVLNKNKYYLTVKEMLSIKNKDLNLFNFIINNGYCVRNKTDVVLCGTEGELYMSNLQYVNSSYVFYHNGQYVSIQSIIKDRLVNDEFMPWYLIHSKPDLRRFKALFIPVKESFQLPDTNMFVNQPGIAHGKGDFIILSDNSRWVVNGLVFRNLYNNNGWQDKLDLNVPSLSYEPNYQIIDDYAIKTSKLIELLKRYNLNNCISYAKRNKVIFEHEDLVINFFKYVNSWHPLKELGVYEESAEDTFQITFCLENITTFNLIFYDNEFSVFGFNHDENSPYYEDCLEVPYLCESDFTAFIEELTKKDLVGINALYKCIESTNFKDKYTYIQMLKESYSDLDNKFKFDNHCSLYIKLFKALNNFGLACKGVNKEKYFESLSFNVLDDDRFSFVLPELEYNGKEINCLTFDNFYDSSITAFGWGSDTEIDPVENNIELSWFNQSLLVLIKQILHEQLTREEEVDEIKSKLSEVQEKELRSFSLFSRGFCLNNVYYVVDTETKNGRLICRYFANLYQYASHNMYLRNRIREISSTDFNKAVTVNDSNLNLLFKIYDKYFTDYAYKLNADIIDIFENEKIYNNKVGIFIECKVRNIYYARIEAEFGVIDCVCFSKSTFECLKFYDKNLEVLNIGKQGSKYKYIKYHQLMFRLGLFRHVLDFKPLKLSTIRLNNEIFKGYIPNTLVVALVEYDIYDSSYTENINGTFIETCGGYHTTRYGNDWLVLRNRQGLYSDLQSNNISSTKYLPTLIHELCHSYCRGFYGTCRENPGEDGGTYYHLSEKFEDQWFCHGKHFGEIVQEAANKTGLSFDTIFSYDIHISNFGLNNGDLSKNLSKCRERNLDVSGVYNIGQVYRYIDLKRMIFCKRCGRLKCNCYEQYKVNLLDNYIMRCSSCGNIENYTVKDLAQGVSPDYMSKIDYYKLLVGRKCNCGGNLYPVINSEEMQVFYKDTIIEQRLKNRYFNISNSSLSKYNNYFNRFGYNIEVTKDSLPCLTFTLTSSNDFKVYYKLFIAADSKKRKHIGLLYKDYGHMNKGYLIHKFRLNTDKNVIEFLDYFMRYLRRDFIQEI